MRKLQKQSAILTISLVILLMAIFAILRLKNRFEKVSLPPTATHETISPKNAKTPIVEDESIVKNPPMEESVAEKNAILQIDLPAEVNLKIPFTSQAPHQNWKLPYQEFCEEASILMAVSYIKGQLILGPDDADARLLAIRKFSEKKLGFPDDTNARDTAKIIREFYKLEKIEIIENPTASDIRNALAQGKVVIAPFAGRELKNPNYQQPGPFYHMLVIKGYQKNGDFITNDPGTKRGADYVYKENVIMNAIHDWNDGDVLSGKKVIITVE